MSSASPFEDLTEFAVAVDELGMDRALADIEGAARVVRPILELGRRQRFDSLLASIRAAREAGTYTEVALNSVEGYRVLVGGLHDEAPTVPKAVSLLDYAGFRLSVLASSETPDWVSIRVTMEQARGFWASIAMRVENKGLRDAMNTTIDGIEHAVSAPSINRLQRTALRVAAEPERHTEYFTCNMIPLDVSLIVALEVSYE